MFSGRGGVAREPKEEESKKKKKKLTRGFYKKTGRIRPGQERPHGCPGRVHVPGRRPLKKRENERKKERRRPPKASFFVFFPLSKDCLFLWKRKKNFSFPPCALLKRPADLNNKNAPTLKYQRGTRTTATCVVQNPGRVGSNKPPPERDFRLWSEPREMSGAPSALGEQTIYFFLFPTFFLLFSNVQSERHV